MHTRGTNQQIPSWQMVWVFRVSLAGYVDRAERRQRSQTRDAADEQSLTVEDAIDRWSTGISSRRKAFIIAWMVGCRATSDCTAEVLPLIRWQPPSTSWLQSACGFPTADLTVFTSRMGSMRSHGLRTKHFSNVKNLWLIWRKRLAC